MTVPNSDVLSPYITRLGVAMASLKERIQCPVCLSVMTNPVQGECEHIFCNACIVKSLDSNKCCPLCKAAMTRRQLWPVPDYNEICSALSKVYDEIDAAVSETTGKSLRETHTGLLVSPRGSKKKQKDVTLDAALKRSLNLVVESMESSEEGTRKKRKVTARVASRKPPVAGRPSAPDCSNTVQETAKISDAVRPDAGFESLPSTLAMSPKAASLPPPESPVKKGGKRRASLDRSLHEDPYEFIPSQAPAPEPAPRKVGGRPRKNLSNPGKTEVVSKKRKNAKSAKSLNNVDVLTKELKEKRGVKTNTAKTATPVSKEVEDVQECRAMIPEHLPDSLVECSVPMKGRTSKRSLKRKRTATADAAVTSEKQQEPEKLGVQKPVTKKKPESKKSTLLSMFANDADLEESFAAADIRRSPPKVTYSRRGNASNSLKKQGMQSPVKFDHSSPVKNRSTPVETEVPDTSQPTPMPAKKRLTRRTFDLEADSEAIEEVMTQAKIPRQGSATSSVADASFVTCPSSDGPVQERVESLQDPDREPFQDSEADSIVPPTVPETGPAKSPSKRGLQAKPAASMNETIVVPDSEPFSSNASAEHKATVVDLEDGVISETSESEDEDMEQSKKGKKKVRKANGDESDSDDSIIFGTPSSQQRRRSASLEVAESNKENELPLLKPLKTGGIMTSGLEPRDNVIVQKLVKRFQLPFSRDFSDQNGQNVTHVIVGQDEAGCAPRTMKFLMGISRNIFVVTIGWAAESLKKNALADENDFLAEIGDTGPRKALEARKKPLVDITVNVKSCDDPLKAEELETLAANMGAQVLRNILEYDGRGTLVVLASEEDRNDRLAERLWGFGAVLVTTEWLIECVASYSCVSLFDYISHPVLKKCLKLIPSVNSKLVEVPEGTVRLSKPSLNFGSAVGRV